MIFLNPRKQATVCLLTICKKKFATQVAEWILIHCAQCIGVVYTSCMQIDPYKSLLGTLGFHFNVFTCWQRRIGKRFWKRWQHTQNVDVVVVVIVCLNDILSTTIEWSPHWFVCHLHMYIVGVTHDRVKQKITARMFLRVISSWCSTWVIESKQARLGVITMCTCSSESCLPLTGKFLRWKLSRFKFSRVSFSPFGKAVQIFVVYN